MVPVIVVVPAEEPITLAEAKLHLRVTSSAEDALLTDLIQAAREYCEMVSKRSFVTRTYDLALDAFPCCGYIKLPAPPVQSITSVTYVDSTGATQTMSSDDYYLANPEGNLVLGYGKSWPSAILRPQNAITVRYVAGYGAASAVPAWVKHAIKLMVGHWYMNREEVVLGTVGHRVPDAAMSLLMANRAY